MATFAEDATLNTYTYDSDGFKKVENAGGSLSTIIWDGTDYLQIRNQNSSTNKTFHTVDSQMMSYIENTFRFDLLTDYLGGVTAIVDGSQIRTFDTRYSAYGRNNWSTGNGCGFGWVGSYGYRETGLFHMSHYVRARHYSYVTGGWSTVDPLWPQESAYEYAGGRATGMVDPSGKWSVGFINCNEDEKGRIMKRLGWITGYITSYPDFWDCLSDTIVNCSGPVGRADPSPVIKGWAVTPPSSTFDIVFTCKHDCPEKKCGEANNKGRPKGIELCLPQGYAPPCGPLDCLILHELIHIGSNGVGHSAQNDPLWTKCMPKIPGCKN